MNENMRYILMLEDDDDDRHITRSFFAEQGYDIGLRFFTEPDELLQYLHDRCDHGAQLPSLIILDKNVPLGSGIDVLKAIKAHPVFMSIPVVIVSGSDVPGDIAESYRCGANSYIVKPLSSELTAKKISTFVRYWFEVVELPQPQHQVIAG